MIRKNGEISRFHFGPSLFFCVKQNLKFIHMSSLVSRILNFRRRNISEKVFIFFI